jgi:hypothetical protein
MTQDENPDVEDAKTETGIVFDDDNGVVHVESETTEIDITGDGRADGLRSVTTETREYDLDGDGETDIVETVTFEETSVDVTGDGLPDVITTVETSEVEMDFTGDGEVDSFEMTEVRTVAHDLDGDGIPNVTRTEVVTASGIDPIEGKFQDVQSAGVRLFGLDTTGDGVIDDVMAEELDVEVVEDDA